MICRTRRAGFTLLELLVVIAIVGVVASLVLPIILDWQKEAMTRKGADQLQAWLQVARSRALYERRANGLRGVRMNVEGRTLNRVATFEYVHDPGFLSQGYVTGTQGQNTVDCNLDFEPNSVLSGDMLQINNAGVLYRITNSITGTGQRQLQITPNLDHNVQAPLNGLPNYRIHRQFRQTPGTPALQLPAEVVVDLDKSVVIAGTTQQSIPSVLGSNIDLGALLFGPNGEVVGQAAPYDIVIFWVRNQRNGGSTHGTDGNDVLVAVITKSGLISSYAVDYASGGDPYSHVKRAQGARTP